MTRTTRLSLFVLAALILVAFIGEVSAFRERSDVILPTQQQGLTTLKDNGFDIAMRIRGGAVAIEIESSDEEETDDEEEEDVPKIAKATKKAAKKAVKKSVAAAMKPKKKKSSLSNFFRVPYIVKACLNPVVFFQMVGGYWKSLYNINYLADKVRSLVLLHMALPKTFHERSTTSILEAVASVQRPIHNWVTKQNVRTRHDVLR